MVPALLLLAVQQWNTAETLDLVHRAVERRHQTEAGARRYTSRANGVVLFLAQLGQEPGAPLRLIKADELAVEVYWEAPSRSKQTIQAWRERRFLPTDISYHRDHLGVVTDDFGDAIRLGDGDEVRDVPHPLSAAGLALYQYALGDSLALASGAARLLVREVLVRPRDPARPAAVGTLYLDAATADLVRFRFSFTGPAYLQPQLEDITVVLERALFEREYWLPWRQEIEIRRRLAWLDIPLRTVIRGRWEIGEYEVNGISQPARLAGGPYGGLRIPRPDTGWAEPLDSAIARAGGTLPRADLATARREVARLVSASALAAQPPARFAFGSVSELVRFNRVQGLAIGFGATVRPGNGKLEWSPRLGYGFSDNRLNGGVTASVRLSQMAISLEASRLVRDLSDWPSISGLLNSLLAQEGARDHGDWLQLDRTVAGVRWLRGNAELRLEAGVETSRSLTVRATPADGAFRPNHPLGGGGVQFGRLGVDAQWGAADGRLLRGAVSFEAGTRERGYARGSLATEAILPVGSTRLSLSGRAGWSDGDVPLWRTFVLGGRATLPGEPYREYGGRRMALARLEWSVASVPAPRLGPWLAGGRLLTLAPFAAIGWTEAPPRAGPWLASDGIRPVLGVASELLFNALRLEAAWAPRAGRVSVLLDASPAWWPLL